jgi:hypothetical protein
MLVRVHANLLDAAYRLQLELNGTAVSHFDVYQTDSFLFSPETEALNAALVFTISAVSLDTGRPVEEALPISISAARLCAIRDGAAA